MKRSSFEQRAMLASPAHAIMSGETRHAVETALAVLRPLDPVMQRRALKAIRVMLDIPDDAP